MNPKRNGTVKACLYNGKLYIDFTKGQTRVNKKLQVLDESTCDIIEKVLCTERPFIVGDVFYKT